MENQEFIIKGSVPGILRVLENDFDMSHDEAKFLIYTLLNRPVEIPTNIVDKNELNVWYLKGDEENYNGEIFNSHLVINFTTFKKEVYHLVYQFLVKYFFSKGIDLILIGADLVYIIFSAIKKIKDTDYCVYARIIELQMGNKNIFFEQKDILTANKDGKCDYQNDDWKCTYLQNTDDCTCNKEKVKLAFEDLEEQKVIKKVGTRWCLVQ